MEYLFDHRPNKEIETQRRIKVSLWAYSYEYLNHSIVSDQKFDEECEKINLEITTNRPDLDVWFKNNFQKHTGQWVRNHPEKQKLEFIIKHYCQQQ